MWEECIRCNEAPAVDDQGYCGHCHWAVRAEVEEGFYQLREYLRRWKWEAGQFFGGINADAPEDELSRRRARRAIS